VGFQKSPELVTCSDRVPSDGLLDWLTLLGRLLTQTLAQLRRQLAAD
jgi:hypothetical protein